MAAPESSSETQPSFKPIQLSLPVERSNASVHIHLSDLSSHTVLLFLSTGHETPQLDVPGDEEEPTTAQAPLPFAATANTATLGSFVYAIPSRTDSTSVLTTPLYVRESSLDAITRVARSLARKLQRPVYVGGELPVAGNVYGGPGGVELGPGGGLETVEEETKVLRRVVEVVAEAIQGKTR